MLNVLKLQNMISLLLKSPTTYKYSSAGGLNIYWGGGGDENDKTIHTVTTSKDNAFFSIPLSPFKHCCTDRVRNLKC